MAAARSLTPPVRPLLESGDRLNEGAYARLEPDTNGVVGSHAFPGLRLAVDAMLDGHLATALAALG